MRWVRIGLICTGVLAAVVVVGLVLLLTIDLGRFKPQVEEIASDALGRPVVIEGAFEPTIGTEIRVVAAGIRIDNPAWAESDAMLTAGRLDVSLDTFSLLSGRILVNNVELDDFAMSLEQREDGSNNWTFGEADAPEEPAEPASPLDLLVRKVRVRNLLVTYADPNRDAPMRIHLAAIDQVQLDSGDLSLEVVGDFNDTPISIEGTAGPFANLLQASAIHYDLRAVIGEIEITSRAEIDSLAAPRKPVVHVAISGPNATYLTDLIGIPPVTRGPLNLVTEMAPVAEQTNLSVRGVFGEFEVDATGSFSDLQDLERANLEFFASGPDAAALGELAGLDSIPEDPYSVRGSINRQGDRVIAESITVEIGDTRFDLSATIDKFPSLDGSVLSLELGGPDFGRFNRLLGLPGRLTGPFRATANLSQSPAGEELVDIAAEAKDIQLRVAGIVSPSPDFVGTDLDVNVKGASLAVIANALDIQDVPAVPFDLTAGLSRVDGGLTIENAALQLGAAEDLRVVIDGLVAEEPDLAGSRATVRVEGASLEKVGSFAAVSGLPPLAFSVGGTIERRANGLEIGGGEVRLGQDMLSIDGLVGNAPLERDTDLRFQASGPDLAETLSAAGVEVELLPAGSFEAAGRIRVRPNDVALDGITARLGGTRARIEGRLGDLSNFDGTEIGIDIDGDSLAGVVAEASGIRFEDVPFTVASKISVAKETLTIDDLAVRIGRGKLDADVSIGMSPMLESGSLSVEASGPNVAEWVPDFADYVPGVAPFDLNGGVRWHDDNLVVERLVLKLAKGSLIANGEVDVANFSNTDFNIEAQIANLGNLGRIAGTELPELPLELSARLVGSATELRLPDLSLTVGPSDLAGTATYSTSAELPTVDVDLTSRFLDPTPFQSKEEDDVEPPATEPPPDGRLIPDAAVPVDALGKLNARVRVSVDELVLPNGPAKDVSLIGTLQDGTLRIEEFELTGQRGTLSGQIDVLPDPAGVRVSTSIDGAEMTLGFTPTSPETVHLLPNYEFRVKLGAVGTTYRDLAGSLDGTVRLVGGSGQIAKMPVPGFFVRDVTSEVLDTVNPFSKKEGFTRVECFAVLLRSVDGQIDGQPALVLQTDKLNIFAEAFLNLKTEGIDVKIETAARKGLGIGVADFVTPFTRVGGTLASPSLALNREDAVKETALAAATMGGSFFAKKFKNRFFGPKDPCGQAVAEADAEMEAISNK